MDTRNTTKGTENSLHNSIVSFKENRNDSSVDRSRIKFL